MGIFFLKCKKSILPLSPSPKSLPLHIAATQEKKASLATTASIPHIRSSSQSLSSSVVKPLNPTLSSVFKNAFSKIICPATTPSSNDSQNASNPSSLSLSVVAMPSRPPKSSSPAGISTLCFNPSSQLMLAGSTVGYTCCWDLRYANMSLMRITSQLLEIFNFWNEVLDLPSNAWPLE